MHLPELECDSNCVRGALCSEQQNADHSYDLHVKFKGGEREKRGEGEREM